MDDIENNEEWTCFVCAPKVLWPLRAQHWALINYIEKQSAKLAKLNVNDDYQMNMLLNFDATTCCAKRNNEVKKPVTVNASTAQVTAATAKRKAAGVDIAAILKRVAIANAANAAKPKMSPVMKVQKSPVKKKDDQVVCTPDIFSMFNEQNAQKGKAKPVNTTPPPLALTRQLAVANRKTPVQQQQKGTNIQVSMAGNTPSPVFHTIGGFRVDLNHAARQDIFRLPNGKLIQV